MRGFVLPDEAAEAAHGRAVAAHAEAPNSLLIIHMLRARRGGRFDTGTARRFSLAAPVSRASSPSSRDARR
ncbi:hypothetical protein GCM10010230_25020 [Streptomyces narbonensis]|nr:hypothetical protein GCM10010230_25020 [Streptomyces narbonensis]